MHSYIDAEMGAWREREREKVKVRLLHGWLDGRLEL